MSFMDVKKRGGGEVRLQEETPLDKDIQVLERQAFQVQTLVPKFKKMVDQLGTSQDTSELRNKLSSNQHTIQLQSKEVKDMLVKLNSRKDSMKQKQQGRVLRVGQNFATTLEDFQQALKRCMAREMAVAPQAPVAVAIPPSDVEANDDREKEALLQPKQQQETLVLDNLVAHNEMIIEERDQDITSLVRDIGELNEMFQDVAVLVHDQGQMLDDIETNITHTADRVEAADEELKSANKQQKSATSKKVCIGILIVALIAVVLVIVLTTTL